jgi:hypothetical protein
MHPKLVSLLHFVAAVGGRILIVRFIPPGGGLYEALIAACGMVLRQGMNGFGPPPVPPEAKP